jgi:hypothetical protein
MAVGAVTDRRGTAPGTGAGVAAASDPLGSLASTISGIRSGRYPSLLYWSVGNDQISRAASLGNFAVLFVAGLCAVLAAIVALHRPDLN